MKEVLVGPEESMLVRLLAGRAILQTDYLSLQVEQRRIEPPGGL